MNSVETALAKIKRGTEQIIPEAELIAALKTGKPLIVKLGMDPTAPDLHLGHAVVLSKMKDFQDLGHQIIIIIGDFTARIGDPTGKSKTRKPLSDQDIKTNTQTYFEQVGKILDPSKITVIYNSQLLGNLTMKDLIDLCAKVTVAQLIEREDFKNRLEQNQPIGMHELLYPLMQGYDSVKINADVEIGGTDQTFNLLMGRKIQEQYGQKPQVIITLPLLEGLDGLEKMSKSLGNYVGLNEPADQAYGKLMSISDVLMWRYFKILLDTSAEEITKMHNNVAAGTSHPMDLKKKMAHEIIAKFWSQREADHAQSTFEALFQQHDYSKAEEVSLPESAENPLWIVSLLKCIDPTMSSSYAKQLIDQGAIKIDEEKINNFQAQVQWKSGMIIKVGKHKIFKIK